MLLFLIPRCSNFLAEKYSFYHTMLVRHYLTQTVPGLQAVSELERSLIGDRLL